MTQPFDPSLVALTGATGFLGRALAHCLLAGGHRVRALVRPAALRDGFPAGAIEWVEGDLSDAESLKKLVDGAGRIIHAAGILGEFGISEDPYRRVNAEGSRNGCGTRFRSFIRTSSWWRMRCWPC